MFQLHWTKSGQWRSPWELKSSHNESMCSWAIVNFYFEQCETEPMNVCFLYLLWAYNICSTYWDYMWMSCHLVFRHFVWGIIYNSLAGFPCMLGDCWFNYGLSMFCTYYIGFVYGICNSYMIYARLFRMGWHSLSPRAAVTSSIPISLTLTNPNQP